MTENSWTNICKIPWRGCGRNQNSKRYWWPLKQYVYRNSWPLMGGATRRGLPILFGNQWELGRTCNSMNTIQVPATFINNCTVYRCGKQVTTHLHKEDWGMPPLPPLTLRIYWLPSLWHLHLYILNAMYYPMCIEAVVPSLGYWIKHRSRALLCNYSSAQSTCPWIIKYMDIWSANIGEHLQINIFFMEGTHFNICAP